MDCLQEVGDPCIRLHDIEHGVLAAPDELVSLPGARAACEDEFVRVGTVAIDLIARGKRVFGQDLVRGADTSPVLDVGKEGCAHLAMNPFLDVGEDAAPLIYIGADGVWVPPESGRRAIDASGPADIGGEPAPYLLKGLRIMIIGPGEHPEVPGHPFRMLESKAAGNDLARCLRHIVLPQSFRARCRGQGLAAGCMPGQ